MGNTRTLASQAATHSAAALKLMNAAQCLDSLFVDGDIYATESVSIRQSAKVKGNIYAPRVGIADGAQFSGSIDMNHKGVAARSDKPLSDPQAERLLTKTG